MTKNALHHVLWIAAWSLLAWIGWQQSAWAEIHVFLGFMDEEVNELLAETLANCPAATVVALSANELDHHIFGRPFESYSADCLKPLRVFERNHHPEGASVGSEIFSHLKNISKTDTVVQSLQKKIAPEAAVRTRQNGQLDPHMTLLEFAPAKPSEDVIVILRNIEMGRQPELMRGYLELILGALQKVGAAAHDQGGLHLHVLGTSGGVSPHLKPGDTATIGSSLYVGLEIDLHADSEFPYYGIVSWISKEMGSPVTFFRQGFATRAQAEQAAIDAFISDRNSRLSELIQVSRRAGDDPSLTTSFFAGPALKERAAELGILLVQMEDAHVIEAARRVGVTASIQRLVTDPPHIPDVVREEVRGWARKEVYTVHTYEEAILWGLKGSRLEDLETNLDLLQFLIWKISESSAFEEFAALAPSVNIFGFDVTVDPFFAEIAAEFLRDARDGRVLATELAEQRTYSGIINKNLYTSLSDSSRAELNRLLDEKSSRIQALARDLIVRAENSAEESVLRGLIRRLLKECLAVDIPIATPLYREVEAQMQGSDEPRARARAELFHRRGKIRLLAASGYMGAEDDPKSAFSKITMEKWIVQTRWDANEGRIARYLGSDGPSAAALDRLFYRSGLLTLTPNFARERALARLNFLRHRQMFRCEDLLTMGL